MNAELNMELCVTYLNGSVLAVDTDELRYKVMKKRTIFCVVIHDCFYNR
jgi:hypothetical protein